MSNALAILGPGTVAALPESVMSRYTIKKQVTRSVLQQVDGVPFCVEFETAAKEGEKLPGSKMDAAWLCDVINLETGELNVLIMNKVLQSELERAFPENSYVGRKFAIVRAKAREEDKRYKLYRILELVEADNSIKSAGTGVIDATTPEAIAHAKKKNGRSPEAAA